MVEPDHLTTLAANRDDASAFWAFGNLWVVLGDSRATNGSFSVMEQLMPAGRAAGPHVHPIGEWFYVMEGRLDLKVDGKAVTGRTGDSVWIPRGTVHSFDIAEPARVLNG